MKTSVVNIKNNNNDFDIYIGRFNPWRRLPQSPFANPFVLNKDRDRDDSMEMYRIWLFMQPDLMEKARKDLRGKVLGCWCKPELCHGDILAQVSDSEDEGQVEYYVGNFPRVLDAVGMAIYCSKNGIAINEAIDHLYLYRLS